MTRGPICGEDVGPGWIDGGTQARMRTPPRGSNDSLSEEEQQLLLDLGQMVLDLLGIVDPTPIADGTNAVISVGRGDWFGAGVSVVSMIPLLGDLAKAGKLGRWAQTVEKSLALMRRNGRFAERARPLLLRISKALSQVSLLDIPKGARPLVVRMQNAIESVLAHSTRPAGMAWLRAYQRAWERYIDSIPLTKLAPNEGVLWSRLDRPKKAPASMPGDGARLAEQLARFDGKTTLEMQIAPYGFERELKVAISRLTELFDADVAKQFEGEAWRRISRRYAQTLSGRIRAHVRLGGPGGLTHTIVSGREPIIVDEIEQLVDAMMMNPQITSVELVDVVTGESRYALRDDVLRAAK